MKKKLYKSNDRVLAGVLGGFADYAGIDPNVVRLIFVGIMLITWFIPMTIFYIVAAIIMPTRHTYYGNQTDHNDNIQEGDYRD